VRAIEIAVRPLERTWQFQQLGSIFETVHMQWWLFRKGALKILLVKEQSVGEGCDQPLCLLKK
jgi:hypothetical protein